MKIHRRVLISGPRYDLLDVARRNLKRKIIEQIRDAGFEAQAFDQGSGATGDLVEGQAWSLDHIDDVIRRCVGVVILGLARWQFTSNRRRVVLASEYCHYEGSLAYTFQLPILALAEADLEHRGIFIPYGLPVVPIRRPDIGWLKEADFQNAFKNWLIALNQRHDVFLGYSSRAKVPARKVKAYLKRLGLTVLDWHDDFAPAGSILERIRDAAAQCSAGVFLFTRDDRAANGEAAPRDNVVFEAGYFAHAKGKPRVLIIREEGSKMPADLGGDIYASLADRSRIAPIKPMIRKFVERL